MVSANPVLTEAAAVIGAMVLAQLVGEADANGHWVEA
jgi:hypothetical protein